MTPSHLLRAALGLFVLAPLSVGGTLTVGPAGSGAQFTEIQAAIDAAAAGDVILVQPGAYSPIVVAKALRILGDGTGVVRVSGAGSAVRVHDLGAGAEFVLAGVNLRTDSVLSVPRSVLLENCAGSVTLADVLLDVVDASAVGLEVRHCGRALLLDVRIIGAGFTSFAGQTARRAVFARDSEVWIANAEIHGGGNFSDFDMRAAHGVEVVNSTLHVWRSRISGGSNPDTLILQVGGGGDGGAGILALHSRVELFGGPTSDVSGGTGSFDLIGGDTFPGGPGLELTQSSVAWIQADVPIHGGLDGIRFFLTPAIRADASSSFTLAPERFPTLVSTATHAQLGASFTLTLEGTPGGFQILYLSSATGPTTAYRGVAGLGLLDPATRVRVVGESLPATGAQSVTLRVPSLPALLGTTLYFQCAEKAANGYAISNPVLVNITR